eukprot:CAMPEP_0201922264 /NCGR_PEP_ID=MMETSP0903-20130614/10343_1 /ASSEMBLY_ACC=CAM_ASM_000552 /TAXON_ID=420261 /ORGANISM="Thalassiosira antarctica, Strain CCMP982" /LENGTH=319 /DNA_ID=CAMNT_0048459365 /DNA_START=218 /DNA_END=1174 /DNA_ORIENTATION=+
MQDQEKKVGGVSPNEMAKDDNATVADLEGGKDAYVSGIAARKNISEDSSAMDVDSNDRDNASKSSNNENAVTGEMEVSKDDNLDKADEENKSDSVEDVELLVQHEDNAADNDKKSVKDIKDCAEGNIEKEKPPGGAEVANDSTPRVNTNAEGNYEKLQCQDELNESATAEEGDDGKMEADDDDAADALKPTENETKDSACKQPENEATLLENKDCNKEADNEEVDEDGDQLAKSTLEVGSERAMAIDRESAPLEKKDCNEKEVNEYGAPLAQSTVEVGSEGTEAENEPTHASTEQQQDCQSDLLLANAEINKLKRENSK